jgi:hypothetical protein
MQDEEELTLEQININRIEESLALIKQGDLRNIEKTTDDLLAAMTKAGD